MGVVLGKLLPPSECCVGVVEQVEEHGPAFARILSELVLRRPVAAATGEVGQDVVYGINEVGTGYSTDREAWEIVSSEG